MNSIITTTLAADIDAVNTDTITLTALPDELVGDFSPGIGRITFQGSLTAERITFTGTTGDGPYTLTGVVRGAENTTATAHAVANNPGPTGTNCKVQLLYTPTDGGSTYPFTVLRGTTNYVPASSSAGDWGDALNQALADAAPGDVIRLIPGAYDQTTNGTYDPTPQATTPGLTILGDGITTTFVTSASPWQLGDGSMVSGIMLSMPIQTHTNNATIAIFNCGTTADNIDGIFLNSRSGCTVYASQCVLNSGYDCINIASGNGNTIYLLGCTLNAVLFGDSTTPVARCIAITSVSSSVGLPHKVIAVNCTMLADTTTDASAQYGAGAIVGGGVSTAVTGTSTIELYNCNITSRGSYGVIADIQVTKVGMQPVIVHGGTGSGTAGAFTTHAPAGATAATFLGDTAAAAAAQLATDTGVLVTNAAGILAPTANSYAGAIHTAFPTVTGTDAGAVAQLAADYAKITHTTASVTTAGLPAAANILTGTTARAIDASGNQVSVTGSASSSVTINAIVLAPNVPFAFPVVAGADYLNADSKALALATSDATQWPDLTAATITLRATLAAGSPAATGSQVTTFTTAGVVDVPTGANKAIHVDLPRAKTSLMVTATSATPPGSPCGSTYEAAVMATLASGDIICLARGRLLVQPMFG